MLKNLKLYLLFLLLFSIGLPTGLSSERVLNSVDTDVLALQDLPIDDLRELAIKAEQMTKVLENTEKIKNLKNIKSENKKLFWLKDHLFSNFIIDGVTDGFKGVISRVIVPITVQAVFTLLIISRFTGIPFPNLVATTWRLAFPAKLSINGSSDAGLLGPYSRKDYVGGFFGAYAMVYDKVFIGLANAYSAMPWVGNATTVD